MNRECGIAPQHAPGVAQVLHSGFRWRSQSAHRAPVPSLAPLLRIPNARPAAPLGARDPGQCADPPAWQAGLEFRVEFGLDFFLAEKMTEETTGVGEPRSFHDSASSSRLTAVKRPSPVAPFPAELHAAGARQRVVASAAVFSDSPHLPSIQPFCCSRWQRRKEGTGFDDEDAAGDLFDAVRNAQTVHRGPDRGPAKTSMSSVPCR